ncbi:WhiB family transcriptional regulator [Actinomadura geliboluensis]|uniref:WhiB family transcriptional regulator n=1 Tax=Actinomadura geliboluensis TaxID=882440 RepID=UPI003710B941
MTKHWSESASCRSLDPELFFPVSREAVYTAQIAPIRRLCAACPVAGPCLEWALATGEPHGIWAGTTPSERRRIRAARGADHPEEHTGPAGSLRPSGSMPAAHEGR